MPRNFYKAYMNKRYSSPAYDESKEYAMEQKINIFFKKIKEKIKSVLR